MKAVIDIPGRYTMGPIWAVSHEKWRYFVGSFIDIMDGVGPVRVQGLLGYSWRGCTQAVRGVIIVLVKGRGDGRSVTLHSR